MNQTYVRNYLLLQCVYCFEARLLYFMLLLSGTKIPEIISLLLGSCS